MNSPFAKATEDKGEWLVVKGLPTLLPNSEQNPEWSVATADDSSTIAGNISNFVIFSLIINENGLIFVVLQVIFVFPAKGAKVNYSACILPNMVQAYRNEEN